MSAGFDHSDDDIALAGEYVLRLLPDAEVREVEKRLLDDVALRRLVAAWEEDFALLADQIPEVAPPAALQKKIETAVFGDAPKRRSWFAGWGGALVGAAMMGPGPGKRGIE